MTHRPHVTVFAGSEHVRRLPMTTFARLSVDALELLVQPRDLPAALRSKVAAAGKRAKGLPGRFSGLLWGTREMRQPTTDQASTSRAAELGVTVHTISFHLRSIYGKLQVHSKSEAVAKALRNRLV